MKLTQLTAILAISLAGVVRAGTPGIAPVRAAETAGVLNQYCVTCHNQRTMTANLAIDRLNLERVQQNPAAWEKVVRKLRLHRGWRPNSTGRRNRIPDGPRCGD